MISVSQEALSTVKVALVNFNGDIAGISQKSSEKAEGIKYEGKEEIKKTVAVVSKLESRITEITKTIEKIELCISQNTAELEKIEGSIPQLEGEIRGLKSKDEMLRSKISSLKDRLSNCNDDDERRQIQEQIDSLEQQSSAVNREIVQLNENIRIAEERKAVLYKQIDDCKTNKANAENELAQTKGKCSKYKSKLDRQKVAYNRMVSDIDSYVGATKKFEISASGEATKSESAVEACISGIDSYMSVNI